MDWILHLIDFIKGLIVFVIGSYITFKYVIPRVMKDAAVATADEIVKHDKVKPIIKKLEPMVIEIESLLAKAKKADLDSLVKQGKDLMETYSKGLKIFIELQATKNKPPPPPKTSKEKKAKA